MRLRLDGELARAYAQALLAIARGDGVISFDEGVRLQQKVRELLDEPVALDDLLLDDPLSPSQLAGLAAGSPFRASGIHPLQLAEQLVADALTILLAKGPATGAETAVLWRFAHALGCSPADFRRVTAHVARWLPPLE
jgi:hypothetical protein